CSNGISSAARGARARWPTRASARCAPGRAPFTASDAELTTASDTDRADTDRADADRANGDRRPETESSRRHGLDERGDARVDLVVLQVRRRAEPHEIASAVDEHAARAQRRDDAARVGDARGDEAGA